MSDRSLAIFAAATIVAFCGGYCAGIYMTVSHVKMAIAQEQFDCQSELPAGVFHFWRSRNDVCDQKDAPK